MRRKAISYQVSAISEKQNLFTYSPIHLFTNKKGASLVELLITLTVFSIIGTMMFSTYSTFLKQVTVERKKTKTELDIFNVSWPLIKEIETAGFGVPKTGTCGTAIGLASDVLTIHSTAAGDNQNAGAWSYVIGTTRGAVYGIDGTAKPGVPIGGNIVIINTLDKSSLGLDTVSTDSAGGGYYYLTVGTTSYTNNVAYWSPTDGSGTNLACYRTDYSLRDYDPASSKPAMCAPDGTVAAEKVRKLSRRTSTDTAALGNYRTMLDCVRTLAFRFGCIDASGNLTWRTDPTLCGTAKLRLMKIGMVIQASAKGGASPERIDLFEDLGSSFVVATTLTSDQRNYKWRKLEQTITLKNQE